MDSFERYIRAVVEGIEYVEQNLHVLEHAELSDSLAAIMEDVLNAVQVVNPGLAEQLENE